MKTIPVRKLKRFVSILLAVLTFFSYSSVFGEDSSSVLYVPLIGITSVPEPSALPNGAGNVRYSYAVKNFLAEVPLTNIQVVDDKCDSVKFIEGDDNHDSKLDYSETWRYQCTTKLGATTESIATATGVANNITAIHKAYATVIVGSNNPAPLVSIVNVTKVAYPLVLPPEGSQITYAYRVNNPGVVPLSDVTVTDDKCSPMSGKLGDTNGNQLLDINEVWIYSCTTTIKQSTTNTATVSAMANGLRASDNYVLTVLVDTPLSQSSPNLLDVGISPDVGATNSSLKITIWGILSGVLAALIILLIFIRKRKVT